MPKNKTKTTTAPEVSLRPFARDDRRYKSSKDQTGVTLLAELGGIRLATGPVFIDGMELKLFVVTGNVVIGQSHDDVCWTYDSFAPAWARFLEAFLVDLNYEFNSVANGWSKETSFSTAMMARELLNIGDGGLGGFPAQEALVRLVEPLDTKLLDEELRRQGREAEANGVEQKGR